jgi:hypothetical protein
VTPCRRPLDPIDVEAVASGADPVVSEDAARHAAGCEACRTRVEASRALLKALDALPAAPPAPLDRLAGRVVRLRPFSSRERRTYALWRVPALLCVGLGATGFALLAHPALTASDQVATGAAAMAPLLALVRSTARWAIDSLMLAPTGLHALSQGLRQEGMIGLAALALLVPLAVGLRRVLARAPGRR